MSVLESLEIRQQIEQPETLGDARLAVLALPGMEHYVPDRGASAEDVDKQLDGMVEQVTLQLDAENMLPQIAYNLGWSAPEAAAFFDHPDRSPYRTPLQFSRELSERARQFITIGNYLRLRYLEDKTAGDPQTTQHARENLRNFLDFSVYHVFAPYDFRYKDRYYGIDPVDRHAGTIKPTEEILDLMRTEVEHVARGSGVEAASLYQDVLEATEGGNFITIVTFLENKKGSPTLRRALEAIVLKRTSDPELIAEKLQLVWATEIYSLAMGVDLELYYELNEYPDGRTIETRLHEFLTRPDYVENVWAHLQKEAAPVVAQSEQTGKPMDFYAILQARAEFHKFPDTTETLAELAAKKQRVWRQMQRILPLAFVDTPLCYVDAPTAIGATPRAVNITYRNEAGSIVNVVIVNVRGYESDLREVTGHELAHKLHAEMLSRAERVGYVPQGSNERVPRSVKEEFSQLVEDQVGIIWRTTSTSGDRAAGGVEPPVSRGEFRDLFHALVVRRQAPYALTQQAVRLAMEEKWMSGGRDAFTPQELQALVDAIAPRVAAWYAEGVPIVQPQARVHNNVDILNPDDGLVYLRKYLVEAVAEKRAPQTAGESPSPQTREPILDMKTAFEQRFGNTWLLNPDARAVLLALLAETGNNYDITTYGRFVQEADLVRIRATLESWGITETLI